VYNFGDEVPTRIIKSIFSSLNFRLGSYRRLTFMLDQDVVAASASSVYRVLKTAGLLRRYHGKPSKRDGVYTTHRSPSALAPRRVVSKRVWDVLLSLRDS